MDNIDLTQEVFRPSPGPDGGSPMRLYVAEEQKIFRDAYQSFFLPQPDIDVVGVSGNTDGDFLARAAASHKPNVMLLGLKILQPITVERLNTIRESSPETAIVLLSAFYDVKGIKALREFPRGTTVGCAYLLKHTIDSVEQLTQVLYSVGQGRIILDPAVMEGLLTSTEAKSALLKELTPRELEVLSWMAKGYRNNTIAEILCLEPKTVERHINSIYSKLATSSESRHARVNAVTLYLKATGMLPAEDFTSD